MPSATTPQSTASIAAVDSAPRAGPATPERISSVVPMPPARKSEPPISFSGTSPVRWASQSRRHPTAKLAIAKSEIPSRASSAKGPSGRKRAPL